MTETGNPLKLWMPATYRIQVQGTVDARYANRLGGLTVVPADASGEEPVTTLCGCLLDQAALFGVLSTLINSLRLPSLLVQCESIEEMNPCTSKGENHGC